MTGGASPGTVVFFQPPHKFDDGTSFGGSMQSLPNVDGVYRPQIIWGLFDYELHGQINPENPPLDLTIAVTDMSLNLYGMLTLDNITTNTDGSFVITIDNTPVNGRTNHL